MATLPPKPNIIQIDLELVDQIQAELAGLDVKRGQMIYEKSLGIHLMYVGNGEYVIKNVI